MKIGIKLNVVTSQNIYLTNNAKQLVYFIPIPSHSPLLKLLRLMSAILLDSVVK